MMMREKKNMMAAAAATINNNAYLPPASNDNNNDFSFFFPSSLVQPHDRAPQGRRPVSGLDAASVDAPRQKVHAFAAGKDDGLGAFR